LEKQLAIVTYWIGVASTAVAVIMRALALLGIYVSPYLPSASGTKIPISYRTFLQGAILFFVMAIASAAVDWVKARKTS